MKYILTLLFILSIFFATAGSIFAYTNNMSASVVIGQSNFSSDTTSVTQTNFANATVRGLFVDPSGRLIVSDGGNGGNNRVLIWNKVPTTNGKAADLVLGQPDFVSNTANNGGRSARTLSTPGGVYSDGSKLYVFDGGNGRVLIWNTFPTTNQQAADVVVGQADMTTANSPCDASHFSFTANGNAFGIYVYNGKLIVSDVNDRRVLIWNSIPSLNGIAADVVLGQPNMSTCTAPSISASSLNSPRGINVDSRGRLFVADGTSANRVLLWNSIPTVNNTTANVVIGQPDFTTSSTPVTAAGLSVPLGVFSTGDRLYIGDNNNNRVLIFNTIPTSNGASADLVLGQSSFTSNTNVGITSYSMQNPQMVFEYQNKLFISEAGGDRILIFDNIINKPGISLNTDSEGRDGGLLRFKGTVQTTTQYIVQSLQYSVNGSGFSNGSATDGNFSSTSEDYYFDLNPKTNQPTDSSGNIIEGYTLRLKSINNNADVTDNLFYFTPFNQVSPNDYATVDAGNLPFEFSVIKQRSVMKENISKYQIQTRKGGSGSTASWETLIDDIPVEGTTDGSGNSTAENDYFKGEYTESMSHIKVISKKSSLSGMNQWRVAAIDKSGHTQYSSIRSMRVNGTTGSVVPVEGFPLAVLNINGLGNPDISTTNLGGMKSAYATTSHNPTFYGIANVGSTVNLELTDSTCEEKGQPDCVKTYNTVTNGESRYGINIPAQSLISGRTYSTRMYVQLNDQYNELPSYDLKVR